MAAAACWGPQPLQKKGGRGVEKTKHILCLSLSSEIGAAAIAEGIHRRRNCNYQKAQKIQIHTTHSLSLFASEFNSMLVESRFCFYYCCQQPKKVQQKKRDLQQSEAWCEERQTDRQEKKKKARWLTGDAFICDVRHIASTRHHLHSNFVHDKNLQRIQRKKHHKRLVAVIIGLLVSVIHNLHHHHHQHINLLHQAWQWQQWWRGYYYSSCHYNSNFISYCCCCCIINQLVVAVQFISQSVVAHLL